MLTALLAAAAFIAGVAGAWSPCGFSMVETLGPRGYAGRRRTTAAACGSFAVGALAGAVATFGGLAWAGEAVGAGGGVAIVLAAAALSIAALGDAAGRRIVPQVRRQVPEHWRRVMPVPLAAGLYGVLLGLGFTTFVLSFAVYGLAGACLALGDTSAGLVVGLAFGAGRTLPVVVLAPLYSGERGMSLAHAMGLAPGVLRGLRGAGAAALCAAALVLAVDGRPAAAAVTIATANGTDPSVHGGELAWQQPDGGAAVHKLAGAKPRFVPGADPALGPDLIAWRDGDGLVVAAHDTLVPLRNLVVRNAEEPAVSADWLVWRARSAERDSLLAQDLRVADGPILLLTVTAPKSIGRPSIDGDEVVFHVARPGSSTIESIDLATRRRTVLRSAVADAQLLNPSLRDGTLLYVRSTATRQELRIGPRRGTDRVLYSTVPVVRPDAGHEPGLHRHGAGYPGGKPPKRPQYAPAGTRIQLWTTALGDERAYVTRVRTTGSRTASRILSIPRS